MQRLMVIGPCGAGKSTASHRIHYLLGLPLHHLDKLHWRAGWIEGSKEELHADLAPILASDSWIIDGNYGSTMEPRIARADTIVYLDFPIRLCLWRAFKRVWQFRGRSRPDMADGCPERFNLEFFLYIAAWNHRARPRTEKLLSGSHDKIIRLKNPRELEDWLARLEANNART
ncbi:topology modulation protein [uncultured Erythrobacter sp.]|uniref:topology modulation protein n=1 Tax=uncultured Erythrobacter sp. TaxID=263913 RepID=UPI00261589A6|nr:topology modulation protein [uncultured Erythrobacter sp.]